MVNVNNVLECRDITLLTKVRIVKTMLFPAITYGCESWSITKAEQQAHEGVISIINKSGK